MVFPPHLSLHIYIISHIFSMYKDDDKSQSAKHLLNLRGCEIVKL
jgi:hypothetical protein